MMLRASLVSLFVLFGSIVPIAGCGGGNGPCTTSDMCAVGFLCVDGDCVPRTDSGTDRDGGSGETDGATGTDGGVGTDGGCGSEGLPIDYRPPNVLVVFDRSCSMRHSFETASFGTGPEDPTTAWNIARESVLSLVRSYEARVFWGLMAFPDPREGCGMPVDAEIAPGPMHAAAIEAALMRDDVQPFGLCGLDNSDTTTQPRSTPTAEALMSAMGLPALSDPMRASFVLLVTDGGVSCGITDDGLSALAGAFVDAGIPLAVVGFTTGASESSLEALAASGGLPNPAGPPSYFVAESRTDLDAIFDSIAERVVSCTLPLSSTPPDDAAIYVYVNDEELAEDATDGWTHDATSNTVTLNGDACARLRRGDIRRIAISFGCAPLMCIPSAEVCNGLDDDCDDAVDEECLL